MNISVPSERTSGPSTSRTLSQQCKVKILFRMRTRARTLSAVHYSKSHLSKCLESYYVSLERTDPRHAIKCFGQDQAGVSKNIFNRQKQILHQAGAFFHVFSFRIMFHPRKRTFVHLISEFHHVMVSCVTHSCTSAILIFSSNGGRIMDYTDTFHRKRTLGL